MLQTLAPFAQQQMVYPSMNSPAWWTTLAVFVLVLVGLSVFNRTTRAGIIARATRKEAVRQPVFFLMALITVLVMVLYTFLPFFGFGEDVKMLKDCGLATLLVSGMLLSIWTSSNSIAAEIEGKTTMTLLSKPINRRQFIVGKFFGIVQANLVLLIPLSIMFLALIYFKVGYDARESGKPVPEWYEWVSSSAVWFDYPAPHPERWYPTVQTIPALLLMLLEIAVLTAVSVAISTRAPMVVNIVTCLAVFVIGHLAPVLVQHATGSKALEFVQFMAQLIATVLPMLEVFNTQAAVATGQLVPPDYLAVSLAYCVCYCGMAILAAFIMFEDRDLA